MSLFYRPSRRLMQSVSFIRPLSSSSRTTVCITKIVNPSLVPNRTPNNSSVLRVFPTLPSSLSIVGYRPFSSSPNTTEKTESSGNENSAWSGPVSWATVALLVVGGAAAVVYNNFMREKKRVETSGKVESYGKPLLGGPWSLVDAQTGTPLTSGNLYGSYSLLYFGFTFCPDICPNELVKMAKVTTMLESRIPQKPITPVFITLDPYRDSCAQVASYVRDFHPRMLGLTGTPNQIAKIAKKFRVYFAEVDHATDDDDYLVDHSIVMYLISPEGEFVDFYTQLMTASEIADKIEKVMKSR